mmetsp:Transcript_7043/g.20596  ORF Transcript_7043/g.20596 Transcript_7043/m.20596 type:complete len:221 (-) Transcript_7043:632-1294(-)
MVRTFQHCLLVPDGGPSEGGAAQVVSSSLGGSFHFQLPRGAVRGAELPPAPPADLRPVRSRVRRRLAKCTQPDAEGEVPCTQPRRLGGRVQLHTGMPGSHVPVPVVWQYDMRLSLLPLLLLLLLLRRRRTSGTTYSRSAVTDWSLVLCASRASSIHVTHHHETCIVCQGIPPLPATMQVQQQLVFVAWTGSVSPLQCMQSQIEPGQYVGPQNTGCHEAVR